MGVAPLRGVGDQLVEQKAAMDERDARWAARAKFALQLAPATQFSASRPAVGKVGVEIEEIEDVVDQVVDGSGPDVEGRDRGAMSAPTRASLSGVSRWPACSGVSRSLRTSGRRSLRTTSAAWVHMFVGTGMTCARKPRARACAGEADRAPERRTSRSAQGSALPPPHDSPGIRNFRRLPISRSASWR
jgi:hypothetical protein